ncbi:peptidoglycan DD-metalloendopeptidase family protein [Oleidesulfovibrio sp.]|uniref:peptidoglycan DD-metalloendopeptidase family protein n=1 Tax=Oleidesulfovibrio sp. TaxID=2909707 RepID=UPI003A86B8B7
MSGPAFDSQMAVSNLEGQDLIRRKREMDALRSRLGDNKSREQRLRESCEGFESLFIQKLWQQMRATVPKEGYLHSRDEEMYQSLFDVELSKKMASAGGIGLADMLYEQLQGQLENASRVTSPAGMADARDVRSLSLKDGAKLPPEDAGTAPAPEVALNGEEEPLYTPLDAQTGNNAEAAQQAGTAPESAKPATPVVVPPAFSAEDARVFTQVEELAQRILKNAEAEKTAEGAEVTGAGGVGGAVDPEGSLNSMHWPIPGRITSGFGWRPDPFTGQREWHAGVDIVGNEGDPVAACWDGKVIFAGEKGDNGNLVVLEHAGGWRSYYGHNSEISVKVGDQVAAGRKIAEVGNTGRSTGPHLHFEVRQGELAWNPEQIRNRLMAGLSIGKRG